MKRVFFVLAIGILGFLRCQASELPSQYFRLLNVGIAQVEQVLAAEPSADLQTLEARPGWRHFPSAILTAAVLYTQKNPANPRFSNVKTLATALAIGDLMAGEQERGQFMTRLDYHRDTYMWLEAYRLLQGKLGEERRARWQRDILEILTPLAADVAQRQDFPWYASPYLGTSPNHYALWSSTIYLAGIVFGNEAWQKLGAKVMHRFAAEEQTPDGYWGEHSHRGPTTGYDYLTSTGVALYWEHSHDPAALEALRRSTEFHMYFTYPDGMPVETVNDRNRYWEPSTWGQFGFSHFPPGRRYSEFLTSFFKEGDVRLEDLGRLAQDALYYHPGPGTAIPQEQSRSLRVMTVPAGIRKVGPWVICLSGIIDTSTTNQFYLDRQAGLSVFHQGQGLIITGANSKRQPELATFSEKIGEQFFAMPVSSKLEMTSGRDRLTLAYNTFFSVLEATVLSDKQLRLRFNVTPRGSIDNSQLNLQLCMKVGQSIETGVGTKLVLGSTRIDLSSQDLGGWIHYPGWKMRIDAPAQLTWPVYPYNPYANAPETTLEHAVAVLSVPLRGSGSESSPRRTLEISILIEAE
ncbi:MAG: hypothetical protein P4N24_21035 [Acidobacteriota bacterium]|nr:hypothetical protein [Acidobacteriota bacterium]